jgi:hypothetical protein
MHGAYITPYKLTWVASFRAALVGASGLVVGVTVGDLGIMMLALVKLVLLGGIHA